jgi:hypothetical protein
MVCFFFCLVLLEEGDLQKISTIDQEIFYLEKEKKQLQRKASSHRRKGEQLQFDRGSFLEARREFFLEQEAEDKLNVIEIKVDHLMEEKKDLLID